MNIQDQYDSEYYFLKETKSIEDTVKYLYTSDSKGTDEMARTLLDLMRMSENWYGRLQEANHIIDRLTKGKGKKCQ